MTRSKLSSKVLLLIGGIGLSVAAFAGQPAAAQEYCPDGLVPDPSYGCTDYGLPRLRLRLSALWWILCLAPRRPRLRPWHGWWLQPWCRFRHFGGFHGGGFGGGGHR